MRRAGSCCTLQRTGHADAVCQQLEAAHYRNHRPHVCIPHLPLRALALLACRPYRDAIWSPSLCAQMAPLTLPPINYLFGSSGRICLGMYAGGETGACLPASQPAFSASPCLHATAPNFRTWVCAAPAWRQPPQGLGGKLALAQRQPPALPCPESCTCPLHCLAPPPAAAAAAARLDCAGAVLGGITFRNVLVQYDLVGRRVGFGPAPCAELAPQ